MMILLAAGMVLLFAVSFTVVIVAIVKGLFNGES